MQIDIENTAWWARIYFHSNCINTSFISYFPDVLVYAWWSITLSYGDVVYVDWQLKIEMNRMVSKSLRYRRNLKNKNTTWKTLK